MFKFETGKVYKLDPKTCRENVKQFRGCTVTSENEIVIGLLIINEPIVGTYIGSFTNSVGYITHKFFYDNQLLAISEDWFTMSGRITVEDTISGKTLTNW